MNVTRFGAIDQNLLRRQLEQAQLTYLAAGQARIDARVLLRDARRVHRALTMAASRAEITTAKSRYQEAIEDAEAADASYATARRDLAALRRQVMIYKQQGSLTAHWPDDAAGHLASP